MSRLRVALVWIGAAMVAASFPVDGLAGVALALVGAAYGVPFLIHHRRSAR